MVQFRETGRGIFGSAFIVIKEHIQFQECTLLIEIMDANWIHIVQPVSTLTTNGYVTLILLL